VTNTTGPATASPRRARNAIAALGVVAILAGTATASAPTAEAAALPATVIDSATTAWSYSDNDTDPAAGDADRLVWTKAAFDDSAWKSATGSFGAKGGKLATFDGVTPKNLLTQYTAGSTTNDVRTFHFRSEFTLTAAQIADVASLRGKVVYDDALQVFVNGTQVAGFVDGRVTAAPEAERNLMYAGESGGAPVGSDFSVPASALVAGENTIAVALYQDRATSSDIYFDMTSLAPVPLNEPATLSDLILTVGADETSRAVTWYSNLDTAQTAQFAPTSAVVDGVFPATAVSVAATGAVTTSGEYNRKAVMGGLAENTAYSYRVGNATNGWSATKTFRTQDFDGDYNFLFFGDPQIGASGNVANDQAGWTDTLRLAEKTYPDAEMLFSAGDQVEAAGSEAQYAAYLAPEQITSIPTAPIIGNHDVGSKAYEQHYSVPNNDPASGAATSGSSSGGDYWYIYKDVLFVVLNSNNGDTASHNAFMTRVVAEQGANAKWKVLAFHHSIYSVASHTNDAQIIALRNALPTMISNLDFDLVLQGHDHSYTRSYLIKDGVVANAAEQQAAPVVEAKDGEVLYVTANSASGSKYYSVQAPNAPFASVINQENVRNYSNIDVTDDSITVTTLRSQQYQDKVVNTVVDKVTLERADAVAPVLAVPADSTVATGAAFDPLTGVTAVDAVDGEITSKVTVTGTVDTTTAGVYALVYSVSDAAGNVSTATRTVTVLAALVQVTAPSVSGAARVGATLTADDGTWSPAATSAAFQWLRNGQPIAGATSATYVTVAADAGAAVSVRVTASRPGAADGVATSAAVNVAALAADPAAQPAAPAASPIAAVLASTGVEVSGLIGFAAALLALGAALVGARRARPARRQG
jgi:hypothetical protein